MAKATISTDLTLDTTRFQRALAQSQNKVKRFASAATTQILRIGAAFAGVSLIKNIISLGTASAETASKFKAVFGPAAEGLDRQIKELKKTIPATTQELRDSTATISQMTRSFGLGEDASNTLSVEIVKLAGDLASFNNMKFEEAFLKIRSAISGEFEPLKQFGIVINEARLKQEGLNTGIWDGTGAMSAAQKALVVHNILISDMGDAHGDAAATADSAANKIKFLKTQLAEAATSIGQTSLPAIVELAKALALLVEYAERFAKASGKTVGEFIYGAESTLNERSMRALAKKQLINERKISEEEPGGWGGALTHRKERNARDQLIEERLQLLLKKQAAEEAEKEAKARKELADELRNQIDAEIDPKRKQALQERLAMYEKLIEMAGRLNSVQSDGIAKMAEERRKMEKLFEQGDANRDGVITGREKRAKEREKKQIEAENRRRRAAAVAAEALVNRNRRRGETDARMTEREQANGLTNTLSGRLANAAQTPAKTFSSKSLESAAKMPDGSTGQKDSIQSQMLASIQKIESNLSQLKTAVSGS